MSRRLENLRAKIDEVDSKIINLLCKRTKLVKKIKEYKKQNNLAIFDKDREKRKYKMSKKLAKERGLNEDFIKKLFKLIIEENKK